METFLIIVSLFSLTMAYGIHLQHMDFERRGMYHLTPMYIGNQSLLLLAIMIGTVLPAFLWNKLLGWKWYVVTPVSILISLTLSNAVAMFVLGTFIGYEHLGQKMMMFLVIGATTFCIAMLI